MRDHILMMNADAILWDGCDDALIGITDNGNAVYSIEKLIDVFVKDGMNDEEANEWVNYNILCAYVGTFTPIHVYTS